jgi:hypothetical protein
MNWENRKNNIKEERNKNPIPEPAELLTLPTSLHSTTAHTGNDY